MALATWWSPDPFPEIPPLAGFQAFSSPNDEVLAQLNQLPLAEVHSRRAEGHRPYLATLNGVPVAYGWVATRTASIGELNLTFSLPANERYLWDFATLPAAQGQGLYPRLLRTILEHESPSADRFWIIFAPENLPSGAGMQKAGFTPVGQLSFRVGGGVGLAPCEGQTTASLRHRASAGATLLGVPLVETVLAPCWCCGNMVEQKPTLSSSCWPPISSNANVCTCAIPVRPFRVTAQPG